MDELFCFKYRRVVLNDNTVRVGTNVIDIPAAANRRLSYAHARVEVQERFNGTFAVYLDGNCIAKKVRAEPGATYRTRNKWTSLSDEPAIPKPQPPQVAPKGPWHPALNHPWRRPTVARPPVKAGAT